MTNGRVGLAAATLFRNLASKPLPARNRTFRDRRPRHYVLRSTKELSESSWSGAGFRLLFRDAAEVDAYLDRAGVRYLVVDKSEPPRLRRRDMVQVEALLASYPDRFRFLEAFPCARRGLVTPGGLELYERI